jgi:hypothetical protein
MMKRAEVSLWDLAVVFLCGFAMALIVTGLGRLW